MFALKNAKIENRSVRFKQLRDFKSTIFETKYQRICEHFAGKYEGKRRWA